MCGDEPEHGDGDYYEMTMGMRVKVSKDYVNFGKLIAGVPATAANGFGGSDGYVLRAQANEVLRRKPPPSHPAKRAQKQMKCCIAKRAEARAGGQRRANDRLQQPTLAGATRAFCSHARARRTVPTTSSFAVRQ